MNLPICGVAMVVVFFFLRLKTPRDSLREKLMKLDWLCVCLLHIHVQRLTEACLLTRGNTLIISSTTAIILGLTWGGIKFPWSSPRVLCPLILGVIGLAGALLYEAKWAKQPTVPLVVLSNRTSIAGCVLFPGIYHRAAPYKAHLQLYRYILARHNRHNCWLYVCSLWPRRYLSLTRRPLRSLSVSKILVLPCLDAKIHAHPRPTWFQSVRLADPVRSGLDFLPISVTISPSAIAQGLIVAKIGNYRGLVRFSLFLAALLASLASLTHMQNFAGWAFMLLGMGLFTTMRVDTPIGVLAVFQIIQGLGMGLLYCTYVRAHLLSRLFLPSTTIRAARLTRLFGQFPVMAPLPLSENASAVALVAFTRAFAQVRLSPVPGYGASQLKQRCAGLGRRRLGYDPPERAAAPAPARRPGALPVARRARVCRHPAHS